LNESGLIPFDVQKKVASQGLYHSFEAGAVEQKHYSTPKSFVNILLPPLSKGRVGVG
jgi:hypothetical protein